MIGVSVSTVFKPIKITRPLTAAARRYLFTASFNVRRDAKRSFKSGKKSSPPGKPPTSHAGGMKNAILFAVDQLAEEAFIGAATRRTKTGHQGAGLQEHGGTVTVFEKGKRRVLRFKPHPFMTPALEKVIPTLPALLAK